MDVRLSDTPHRRFNFLTGEWVLVSPHRTKRPWQGKVETLPPDDRPQYDPKCYLCPGNERAGGVKNPDYEHNFVFTNDFAALLPSQPDLSPAQEDPKSLLRAETESGTCRVICFSPRHDLTLPEMDPSDIRRVVDLWAGQYSELAARYRWVQIFENKGALMGCSNPHPHGQIWAGSFLPNEPAKEDAQQARYFAEHKSLLLMDYLAEELGDGTRVVEENPHWVALVPWWAVWPFELLLLPRRAVGSLPELDDAERDDLADILKKILTRYDNLFRISFPYSMGWHGRPGKIARGEDFSHWQLHAHFYPPLLRSATVRKFLVGYEMLAEAQRDITAEQAAERLRECSTRHWKLDLHPRADRGAVTEQAVCDAFRKHFGAAAEFVVRTPGRVNLIGEHTDYNGGFVFPMTLDRAVWMAVRRRKDGVVRVRSLDYDEECRFDSGADLKKDGSSWFEYVRGCAKVLRDEGRPLTGFDAVLAGDVPQGAGLSSSAALEVTSLLAFAEIGGFRLSGEETAKLGQRAENQWIGVQCGIMDQTICALGQADKALLLDCRSLEHRFYDLPAETVVAVLDTATRHSLAASAYNERREQCEAACRIMGVPLLRDATQEMLDLHRKDMSDVVYRRARHILGENLRVHAAAAALNRGAADAFGKLMNESHFSLQYDYEVSCYELDAITTIARRHPACIGARMTGGGFGGSAVALLHAGADDFAEWMTKSYYRETGKDAHVYICRATDGGCVKRL